MSRLKILIPVLVAVFVGGAGRASTFPARADFCAALEGFASAEPRGQSRQVHFFWPAESVSEDGSIDVHFYAAIAADPMDEAARAMQSAYARSTHYIVLEKLKARFDACRAVRKGIVEVEASAAACDGHESAQACLRIRRPARP